MQGAKNLFCQHRFRYHHFEWGCVLKLINYDIKCERYWEKIYVFYIWYWQKLKDASYVSGRTEQVLQKYADVDLLKKFAKNYEKL